MLRTARLATSLAGLAFLTIGCTAEPVAEEPAASPVFLTGTVLDDGKPVPGASVSVDLRDERAEAAAEVGDTIPTLTADQVTTDARGEFTLRVDPTEVPTSYFVGGEGRSLLNYDLHIVTPSAVVPWSSTMHGNGEIWRSDEGAVAADAVVTIEVDLGTDRLTLTDSFGDATNHDAPVLPGPG